MAFNIEINDRNGFPIINLQDKNSGTEAEIYAFGGLLNAFRVPVKGSVQNIIEGFAGREDVITNITNGFKSAKLSPFVCRMYEGKYEWEGKAYQTQKHYLNGHAIHGLIYDGIYKITDQQTDTEKATITLAYSYEGTDAGYPFPYGITICWTLETGNLLTVRTTVLNTGTKAIPMADGWHPYFTLGGKVDDWHIQFDSTTQLEYDAALLPSGKKFQDERFKKGRSLQGIELDNSFELESGNPAARCVLSNDELELTVSPDAAYPLLQLYIPQHRKSIAIENLSGAPDNFNNGMWCIRLEPAQEKKFSTCYQAKEKK